MDVINYEFIKKRRIEKGYSLQDMALKLGFKNASTYFKYEKGEYSLRAEMLPLLAKHLDCKVENFFTI